MDHIGRMFEPDCVWAPAALSGVSARRAWSNSSSADLVPLTVGILCFLSRPCKSQFASFQQAHAVGDRLVPERLSLLERLLYARLEAESGFREAGYSIVWSKNLLSGMLVFQELLDSHPGPLAPA